LAFLMLFALIGGLVGTFVAQAKGRSVGEGFLWGALLGPIGWIIVGLLPADTENVSTSPRRPCPHCAEMIQPAANICRYCQRDVEPLVLVVPDPDYTGPAVECSDCGRRVPESRAHWFLGRWWCPEDYQRALR
jgi:hypothetical protein